MPQSAARDEALESADFAVETIGVSKTFDGPTGPVHALHQVSIGIARNEFFTLLGPSGCGKTTLLRLVAGFETPTAGEIRLEGEPIDDRPPYQRLVNTVFQNYALFPHKTVGDNIGFGLQMRGFDGGEIRQRVSEMLALVRLEDMAGRMPDQLSGGQQQRVALARALANHPTVLLLDEPLSALDYKLRKDMRLELKRLQRETGITFIFVTHDQEEALEMSDRVAVMSNGEVQQIDEPVEVYERPVNRFVADFIGETNFIEAEITREEDARLVCTVPGSGELYASGDGGVGSRVTIAVRPEAAVLAPVGSDDAPLSGEVVERVYQGSTTAYHVKLADGQIVIGRAGDGSFTVGDRAALRVRPSGARVVQE